MENVAVWEWTDSDGAGRSLFFLFTRDIVFVV
jgi:hypothetical protein